MPYGSPEGEGLIRWRPTVETIARAPGLTMVIGASDCGKTTWVRFAAKTLQQLGTASIAVIDADLGQSTFGPPATVALYLADQHRDIDHDAECGAYRALAFIGSVTPLGHLLQTLTACHRLADNAKGLGAATILVDTSGLVSGGVGFQLKLRKAEILEPRHLIALQRATELEPLLSVISGQQGTRIHRLPVPSGITLRRPPERAAYRAHRFAVYFREAQTRLLATNSLLCFPPVVRYRSSFPFPPVFPAESIPPHVAEQLSGLLVGLNNAADETLGLGILEGIDYDRRLFAISTPLHDVSRVKMIQFSHLRMNCSPE